MSPVDDCSVSQDETKRRPLLQMAPMLDVSYEDYRQLMRILTKRAQLWTEMVVDSTLIYSQKEGRSLSCFLDFAPHEHPIVCQLGGSDPNSLAEAAQIVERWGYDEINLNVGCPSDRVCCRGEFGAVLMKRPELVRDCIHEMSRRVQIPVTVKTRLGVDDLDTPEFTSNFIKTVRAGGCRHFIMHARKAFLKGLSPAQNRSVPPLRYERVAQVCKEFPDLDFSLNGGVVTLEQAKGLLQQAPKNLLGVMMGRATMNNPCILWDVDRYIYGESNPHSAPSRRTIVDEYCAYLEKAHPPDSEAAERAGVSHRAMKPILGLFTGLPGNKHFRNALDTRIRDKDMRTEGPAAILKGVLATLGSELGMLDSILPSAGAPEEHTAELLPVGGVKEVVVPPPGQGRKRKHAAAMEAAAAAAAAAADDASQKEPASKEPRVDTADGCADA
mmetsp:Transcript_43615/g.102839  ORF Transcript_43615/g.102839 Transcript_43615/m.102839 type:complete len:442 (+) Transcript_43615:75-1400(+)